MVTARSEYDRDSQGLCAVPDVAKHLALSRSKVYQMMDAGLLPYVKLGKSRRVKWADVLTLIEESTISRS